MWIRSQDRDCLINVNDVCFYKLTYEGIKTYQFRCYGYGNGYYILGNYSSKEKAMKVLDKIHETLLSDLEMNLDVFQMPQDDEV